MIDFSSCWGLQAGLCYIIRVNPYKKVTVLNSNVDFSEIVRNPLFEGIKHSGDSQKIECPRDLGFLIRVYQGTIICIEDI